MCKLIFFFCNFLAAHFSLPQPFLLLRKSNTDYIHNHNHTTIQKLVKAGKSKVGKLKFFFFFQKLEPKCELRLKAGTGSLLLGL
jgi:hypothetical protein